MRTFDGKFMGKRVRVTFEGKGGKVTQVLQHVPEHNGNPESWGSGNVGLTAMVTQAIEEAGVGEHLLAQATEVK
jgi:hypothetical protein